MSASESAEEPGRARQLARRSALVLGVFVLLLLPVLLRTFVDGRAALAEADRAAAVEDLDAQVRELGRAARWQLPLASHDDQARARLAELGRAASEAGQLEQGLASWRELRRALVGTRSLGAAGASQDAGLAEANTAIVALMVAQAREAGEPVEAERWAAELEEDLGSRGRSVAAAACFACFLLGCLAFFVLGLDAKGRLEPRPALRYGVLALLAVAGWIALS